MLTKDLAVAIRKHEASPPPPVREREVIEQVVVDSPPRRTRDHLIVERSPSQHRARSRVRGEVVKKREVSEVRPRSVSVHRHRRQSSPVRIVERRDVESNALVLAERPRRTEREIQEEIRALEEEKRMLQLERRGEHNVGSVDVIRDKVIDRGNEREEIIEVRKDRKGRMSLARKRT